MSDLVPAGNPTFTFEGHDVRVIMRDDEPWWVAADVCAVLEISNVGMAVGRLEEADVSQADVSSGGQRRQVNMINESGLYDLIIRSDKPAARPFRRWVTSEVLPAIRKTGGYRAAMSPRELAQLVIAEADRADKAEARAIEAEDTVALQEPMVAGYRQLIDAGGQFSMAQVAKAFNCGPNRLFIFLRRYSMASARGTLISVAGERFNTPYQAEIAAGRFVVKMQTYPDRDGNQRASWTTMVTPKGVDYVNELIQRYGRP